MASIGRKKYCFPTQQEVWVEFNIIITTNLITWVRSAWSQLSLNTFLFLWTDYRISTSLSFFQKLCTSGRFHCKSLQMEGCRPSRQHQERIHPQLLSLRLVAASGLERLRSCCSSQDFLHSQMSQHRCSSYAAMRLLSFLQLAVLTLPLEWSAFWKWAGHSQRWAEVSGARSFVWTWRRTFLWTRLGMYLWGMRSMWVALGGMLERQEGCYWLLERRLQFGEVPLAFVGLMSPRDQRKKSRTQLGRWYWCSPVQCTEMKNIISAGKNIC